MQRCGISHGGIPSKICREDGRSGRTSQAEARRTCAFICEQALRRAQPEAE
jgi:hypothetical protein